MKILTLTVSVGKGHNKAAEAIKDYFEKNYENCDMKVVDTLKYINPIVNKLVVGSYLNTVKKTPSLYAKLYDYTEADDTLSNFSEMVNDIFSLKIKSLIKKFEPDVVLCTHPFPLEMVSILKRKEKISTPLAAIITDYAPHPFWLYDHVDAYVIPHEDFIQNLVERGIPSETIYPYGIPVLSDFFVSISKEDAQKKLGLDDKLTVLLMGGGLGIGNMKSIFEKLALSNLDIQIITCTGHNKMLKNQLEEIKSLCSKNILIYEYCDDVSTLMSASDILISKPGGLTITEAIIKNLPIVITSAIPGQEERNADYLQNNGIAARVRETDNIVVVIKQLINSPSRLNHMRESTIEKAKPNAAKDICSLLMKLAK